MNKLTKLQTAKRRVSLFLAGAATSMVALNASAAGESGAVIAKMEEYGEEAVLIGVAFAVVCWGIAAVALLRRKS